MSLTQSFPFLPKTHLMKDSRDQTGDFFRMQTKGSSTISSLHLSINLEMKNLGLVQSDFIRKPLAMTAALQSRNISVSVFHGCKVMS